MTLWMHILTVTLTLIPVLRCSVEMPYRAIKGSSSEINVIGNTLTCDELRNDINTCGIECFNRSQSAIECPGFYTEESSNHESCTMCHVSSLAEIQSTSFTTFTNDHILYLLYVDPIVPEVLVDFENYSANGGIIYGVNTEGTTTDVVESDFVESSVSKTALHLHNTGRVSLSGWEDRCWTNLEHCTSGVTLSIWVKPEAFNATYIAGTGAIRSKGVSFALGDGGVVRTKATLDTYWFDAIATTRLSMNQWYHLTGSYHPVEGVFIWINGVFQRQNQFENPTNFTVSQVNWGASIGVRDTVYHDDLYTLQGYVDEFKYYYRLLDSVEVWREYMGHILDLIQPSVSPVSHIVHNGNDYSALVEENVTCSAMKLKLWNVEAEQPDFTMIIKDQFMKCGKKGFALYGQQTIPEELRGQLCPCGGGMTYTRAMQNGYEECVYEQDCSQLCYSVYTNAYSLEQSVSWRFCEVEFN